MINDIVRLRAVQMWLEGDKQVYLAEVFGVSQQTISQWIKQYASRVIDIEHDWMKICYEEGMLE